MSYNVNPCANMFTVLLLAGGVLVSAVSCFVHRAGYRLGYRSGHRAACRDFEKIIIAAQAVDVFGPAVSRLLNMTTPHDDDTTGTGGAL